MGSEMCIRDRSPVSAFSGGTGNYSYAWYKDGILRGNSPNLENLEVGNYSLTVSDTILNCSISQEFTVGGYDQLKLNILASSGPNLRLQQVLEQQQML